MTEEPAPVPAPSALPPLSRPIDALAAVANLNAAHPSCEHARAAAALLRAYALRHNARLAERAADLRRREDAAREAGGADGAV